MKGIGPLKDGSRKAAGEIDRRKGSIEMEIERSGPEMAGNGR